MRGTGIGCCFDDAVHELIDVRNHKPLSMYHFTISAALGDTCLQKDGARGADTLFPLVVLPVPAAASNL